MSAEIQAAKLQQAIDKMEILDALARYARGCDRVAPEVMVSAYHEDSWDYHGSFQGTGREMSYDEKRRSPDNVIVHHALCQSLIELDGDVARVETYYIASGLRNYPDGTKVHRIYGRYLDRFERRDGEWRIAVRRAVVDFSQEEPAGHPWPPESNYDRGRRWPDDLVFHFDEAVRSPSESVSSS